MYWAWMPSRDRRGGGCLRSSLIFAMNKSLYPTIKNGFIMSKIDIEDALCRGSFRYMKKNDLFY